MSSEEEGEAGWSTRGLMCVCEFDDDERTTDENLLISLCRVIMYTHPSSNNDFPSFGAKEHAVILRLPIIFNFVVTRTLRQRLFEL